MLPAARRFVPDKTRRIMALFELPADAGQVSLGQVSATLWRFNQHLGSGRYWQVDLKQLTSPPMHLNVDRVGLPMLTKDDSDPSVTFTGTWVNNTRAESFGGFYKHSVTTGDYVEWVTPAGTINGGMRVTTASNGGYGLVTVDGSTTAANLLPTAQQEVDAGRLASTALVANGGTLNPTDRVYEFYSTGAAYDVQVALVEGMAPAAHTIRITVTGYKRAAATLARVFFSAYTWADSAVTLTTPDAIVIAASTFMTFNAAWESAMRIRPAGATTFEWAGNVHFNETQDDISLKVDGVTTVLTDGQIAEAASVIEVTRLSHLVHPETGATAIANVVTVYRLTRDGLAVTQDMTWLVATDITTFYPAMFPTGASFYRAAVVGSPNLTLTNTDDSFNGSTKSQLAYCWQPTGRYAGLMYVPDPVSVAVGWVNSDPEYLTWLDSAGPAKKAYFTRRGSNGAAISVQPNDTFPTALRVYRRQYFTDPEAVLANVA